MMSLQEIADEAIKLVPKDYKWEWCSFCSQIEHDDCGGLWMATNKAPGFRSSPTDAPKEWGGLEIVVPTPDNAQCLFILLHEIAHVQLHGKATIDLWPGTREMYQKEMEASTWAKEFMEKRGMAVPPRMWELAHQFASGEL